MRIDLAALQLLDAVDQRICIVVGGLCAGGVDVALLDGHAALIQRVHAADDLCLGVDTGSVHRLDRAERHRVVLGEDGVKAVVTVLCDPVFHLGHGADLVELVILIVEDRDVAGRQCIVEALTAQDGAGVALGAAEHQDLAVLRDLVNDCHGGLIGQIILRADKVRAFALEEVPRDGVVDDVGAHILKLLDVVTVIREGAIHDKIPVALGNAALQEWLNLSSVVLAVEQRHLDVVKVLFNGLLADQRGLMMPLVGGSMQPCHLKGILLFAGVVIRLGIRGGVVVCRRFVAGGGVILGAGDQRERHNEREKQCDPFFHFHDSFLNVLCL